MATETEQAAAEFHTPAAIPNWMAFQVLGENLEQLELRLIRMHDSAGEHRQHQIESVFRVFKTVQHTYRQIEGELLCKALGGK